MKDRKLGGGMVRGGERLFVVVFFFSSWARDTGC